jgi:hypothetical protein
LYSGVEANASSIAADHGLHATLERLQHDVAGEAVGDDDVDVGRHDVASLDVADERRCRPPTAPAASRA